MFNLYLGTVIASIVLSIIAALDKYKKLEEEGYVPKESTLEEGLISLLSIIIKLSIPIYNLFLALGLILIDYETAKEGLLKKGSIYLKEAKEEKANLKEQTNEIELEMEKEDTYSEMTPEEKLALIESEREYLLSLINTENLEEEQTLGRRLK